MSVIDDDDPESQAYKRRTLFNDARVRERGSTLMDHTHNETGGRFARVSEQTIIGQPKDPWPKMPKDNPWAGPDIIPPERPFNVQLHSFDVPLHSVVEKKR